MILLIDNYDSFTFNIKHYFNTLGHRVLILKNDDPRLDDLDALDCSHIVLSPGPSSPKNAGKTLSVIKQYHQRYPILGGVVS